MKADEALGVLALGIILLAGRVCAEDAADEARRYGTLCLEASCGEGIAPFYLGYAHEALARAEAVAGNEAKAGEHLAEARRIAEGLPNPDAKKQLLADLGGLAAQLKA